MKQAKTGRVLLPLAALTVLGDAVLILPGKGSGKYLFLGAVTAILIAFLLYGAVLFVLDFLLKRKNRIYAKAILAISSFPIAAYAFFCGALCFRRFVRFASEILLPHTHKVWIFLIFTAVVFALAVKPNEVIFKFSLPAFTVCGSVIVLILILSGRDFKIGNIAIYSLPDAGTLTRETVPFLKSITAPALLIPVYQAVYEKRIEPGACLRGLAAGSLLLIACFAECLLLFGVALSARFDYPLYSAVSTVTVGPLFTRMDGVAYGLFFLTALVKTVLCFRLAVALLRRLHERGGGTERR